MFSIGTMGSVGVSCTGYFVFTTNRFVTRTSGVLEPDALLGDLLFPVVSLSVAVILFEGSLPLHFQNLKALVKWFETSVQSEDHDLPGHKSQYHWILELNWRVAAVLGAVLLQALLSCATFKLYEAHPRYRPYPPLGRHRD